MEWDRDGDLPALRDVGPVVWLLHSKPGLRLCAGDSFGKANIRQSYLPPSILYPGPTNFSQGPPLFSQREQNGSQEDAGLCYTERDWETRSDYVSTCCSKGEWQVRRAGAVAFRGPLGSFRLSSPSLPAGFFSAPRPYTPPNAGCAGWGGVLSVDYK